MNSSATQNAPTRAQKALMNLFGALAVGYVGLTLGASLAHTAQGIQTSLTATVHSLHPGASLQLGKGGTAYRSSAPALTNELAR